MQKRCTSHALDFFDANLLSREKFMQYLSARRSFLVGAALTASDAGGKKVISPMTTGATIQLTWRPPSLWPTRSGVSNIGADPGKGVVLLKVRSRPRPTSPSRSVRTTSFCWPMMTVSDQSRLSLPRSQGKVRWWFPMSQAAQKKNSGYGGMGGMIGGGGGSSPGNSRPVTLNSKMNEQRQGRQEAAARAGRETTDRRRSPPSRLRDSSIFRSTGSTS